MTIPGVSRQIRHQAIDEYLSYGYVPHPGTIFQQVQKLPPAHVAIYEHGSFSTRCYWAPELKPDDQASPIELKENLQAAVNDAVRLRMRSDVPLGAFLSGGIDSTIITGVMQQYASRPTLTFTIGFPVEGFDESEYAKIASEHLGTQHQVMEVQPDSLSLLEELVWLFDEPFADSSAIPTYYLSQLTRQHVKVALTGDGGDELFAGYDRYRTVDRLRHFDRLPQPIRRLLTSPWHHALPSGPEVSIRRRLKHRLEILRAPLEKRYVNWVSGFPASHRAALYQPDVLDQMSPESSLRFLESLLEQTAGMRPGIRAMRADMRSYLPCDLLAKVDITSMAHGLECRSPFLDHHVVEAAGRFSFGLLARPGEIKPVLTHAFKQHLPRSLRDRPKMGFSVPLDRWFRNDLESFARDLLLSSDAFTHNYFRPAAIEQLLEEHRSKQWRHGDRIWSLLFLELWGRKQCQTNDSFPNA